MNEWEKIVLPLKGKQEIQKRSPGTFHVEARRQDEATVISGEYCFEGDGYVVDCGDKSPD